MSYAKIRLHARVKGHNQGSNVKLRDLRGALLITVTLIVTLATLPKLNTEN